MKCPFCGYARLGNEVRCPNCREALTIWRNLDAYGRQAYQAGLDALSEGSPATAEFFMRAVLFAPQEPAHLDAYGHVLAQLGRHAEAAAVLAKAQQLAPTPEREAARLKAEELANESTAEQARSAAPDERHPLGLIAFPLDEAPCIAAAECAQGPADTDTWRLAVELEGNWEQFAPFAKLLDWVPESDAARGGALCYVRGLEAYLARDDEKARQFFRKAIELDTPYRNAEIYLIHLSDSATLDELLAWLTERGRSATQLAKTLRIAAKVEEVHRREFAPALLKRAIGLATDERDEFCRDLAASCRTPAELEDACGVWQRALEVRPTLPLLLLLGDASLKLKQHEPAEQLYQRAAGEYPAAWEPRERLALLHEQRGQLDAALEFCRQALELGDLPADGRFQLNRVRARLLAKLQRWTEAAEAGQVLRTLRPEDKDVAQFNEHVQARLAESSPAADIAPEAGTLPPRAEAP
jgi:tetratricopeptide (TPR) repeat protein